MCVCVGGSYMYDMNVMVMVATGLPLCVWGQCGVCVCWGGGGGVTCMT